MIQDACMIQFIICFITDLSGVVPELKRKFNQSGNPCRPWDCSLCLTFWTVLIHSTLHYGFSLRTLFLATLLAATADLMTTLIIAIKDGLVRLLSHIR